MLTRLANIHRMETLQFPKKIAFISLILSMESFFVLSISSTASPVVSSSAAAAAATFGSLRGRSAQDSDVILFEWPQTASNLFVCKAKHCGVTRRNVRDLTCLMSGSPGGFSRASWHWDVCGLRLSQKRQREWYVNPAAVCSLVYRKIQTVSEKIPFGMRAQRSRERSSPLNSSDPAPPRFSPLHFGFIIKGLEHTSVEKIEAEGSVLWIMH